MLSNKTIAEGVRQNQCGWKAISASVRGSSHIRTGMPNQDACDYTSEGEGAQASAVILAVADGHGGARHFRSQTGSALAVQVALAVLRSAAQVRSSFRDDEARHSELAKQIGQAWRSAVLADIERNPFTEEEANALSELPDGTSGAMQPDPAIAYGATLLAAVATESYVSLLQIGDGDILAVDADGQTTRPIPPDDRLIGNQTTSLCQPDAWKDFRCATIRCGTGFPALLLLSTDGYANSFRTEPDFLKIGRDYLALIRERGLDSLAEELPEILADASKSGSADDVTLGIIYNGGIAANVSPIAANAAPSKTRPPTFRRRVTPLLSLVVILSLVAFGFFRYGARVRDFTSRKHPDIRTSPTQGQPSDNSKPPSTASPAQSQHKPANRPPKGKQWALDLGGDRQIPLRPGDQLTASLLFNGDKTKSDDVYASVRDKDGTLSLVNESPDTWTVSGGAKRTNQPVEPGGSVELASNIKLILHSHTAKLILRRAR